MFNPHITSSLDAAERFEADALLVPASWYDEPVRYTAHADELTELGLDLSLEMVTH